jgi:sec-independent protein translocase protein TatA
MSEGCYSQVMIAALGTPEIVLVCVVVAVLFGGAKIPKFARSLGQAQKEFKKGLEEGTKEDGASKSE